MKVVLFLLFLVPIISVKSQEEEVIQIVTSNGNTKNGGKDIFEFVEEQPEFIGGMDAMYKFLGKEIVYPEDARKANIQGKVYVKFVVTKSGKIGEVKIVRGVHKLLDREAIRAIKAMPKWNPGRQKGKKVNVWFTLPINFNLDEGGK